MSFIDLELEGTEAKISLPYDDAFYFVVKFAKRFPEVAAKIIEVQASGQEVRCPFPSLCDRPCENLSCGGLPHQETDEGPQEDRESENIGGENDQILELDLEPETLLELCMRAHKEDITLNQYLNNLLYEMINDEEFLNSLKPDEDGSCE